MRSLSLSVILIGLAHSCFRRFNIVKKVVGDIESTYDRLIHQEVPKTLVARISGEGSFENRIPSETLRVPPSDAEIDTNSIPLSLYETDSKSFRVQSFLFKRKLDKLSRSKDSGFLQKVKENVEKLSPLISSKAKFEHTDESREIVAEQFKQISDKIEMIEHVPVFVGRANESYHWIDDITLIFQGLKHRPELEQFSDSLLSRFKKMQQEDPINDKKLHEAIGKELSRITELQEKIQRGISLQKIQGEAIREVLSRADFSKIFELFAKQSSSEAESLDFTPEEESTVLNKLAQLSDFQRSFEETSLEELKSGVSETISLQKEQRLSLHNLQELEEKLNQSVVETQRKIEEIRKEIEDMNRQVSGLEEVLETIVTHTVTK